MAASVGVKQELIVRAALTLLDEVGLEGLTMRRLATALKIQAPSLYWHFPKKQALLDGMADDIFGAVSLRRNLKGKAWDERRRLLSVPSGGLFSPIGTALVSSPARMSLPTTCFESSKP